MVGVDFGGTRIKAGVVSGAEVVRSDSVETPHGQGPVAVLDALAALVRRLDPNPAKVGVAIPGECDAGGRCLRMPNVPGFDGVPVAAELTARLGAKVVVENDATTAALGESLHGHGRDHASFVLVTLGTGIGGGVVIDRRLVRGAHGFGGEIGHVLIDRSPDAPRCACGQTGCVEAYAGTHALLAGFRAQGGECREVHDVAIAAKAGDARAQRVFDQMGDALGCMLTNVQNILDVDAVVFSGGISASFDLIAPGLRARLRARAHAPVLGDVPLLVSALGDKAGIIGAANL